MNDLSGCVVGERYAIDREIGRGGMATVWLARDSHYDRPVAIKTLHPELAGAMGTDRFLRELRLTARLQHPNIVAILDSGAVERGDGSRAPWFAMPYLEGESLRARLAREQQLPIDEALRIVTEVGEALAAAHRQQIIHRDIKPENIFLAGHHVYVVDFGIAKALGAMDADRLTSTGLAIGTPAYMSPEQSAGERIDARTDQYSLATVLYEMLAGEPPFTGPTAQAIFARRLVEPARPLATVRTTIPLAVERATLRALERTPADRFLDVSAFVDALRATDGGTGTNPVRQWPRSRLALAAGLLLAVIGSAAWLTIVNRAPRPHVVAPDLVALHQRAVRAYDRRSPAGVVEAVGTLRTVLERDSLYAAAWNSLAKSYARAFLRSYRIPNVSRDLLIPAAVEAIDRSLQLDSTSADAWLTRGMVSAQFDPVYPTTALRAVQRSIEIDSTRAQAWYYLALYRAETNDFDGAIAAWQECVRRGPTYVEGVAFLALGHYWRQNFDSAAFWADSALALDPTFLLGHSTVGFVELARGNVVRAESAFEAWRRLSTDVEVVYALGGLALAKASAGNRASAELTAQRAESLAVAYEPLPPHAAVYIAQAWSALGNSDRALAVLRRFEPVRHAHFQLHLRCDPPFASLRRDPRFRALLTTPQPVANTGC